MSCPLDEGAPYDAATIEYEAQIARLFAEESEWQIAPFAVTWLRDEKVRVYFDYVNRPICRVTRDGQAEIVPPGEHVLFWLLADLHADLDGNFDPNGRKFVIGLIEQYDLAPELRRRWKLFHRGELPDPAWGGRP